MSTDLTKLSPAELAAPEALAAYLAALAVPSAPEDDSDINPNKLIPQLRMSKDNDLLSLKMDEQVLATSKNMYILISLRQGSRALWPPMNHPNKDGWKQPVCSTGLTDPKLLAEEKVTAAWLANSEFRQPKSVKDASGNIVEVEDGQMVQMACAGCVYNLFGSEVGWDSSKSDSKGKACKEARHLFVHLMRKVPGAAPLSTGAEELWLYEQDPSYKTFARFPLSLGSNKAALEQMLLAAKARGLPAESVVFKVGVRIEAPGGSIKFPVMTYEVAGIPTPSAKQLQRADLENIKSFIERNKRKVAVDEAPF